MSTFDRIFKINRSGFGYREELISMNICPNNWVRQEYQDAFDDIVSSANSSFDNQNRSQQKAFIQKFVETNISDISLRLKQKRLTCSRCKKNFSSALKRSD